MEGVSRRRAIKAYCDKDALRIRSNTWTCRGLGLKMLGKWSPYAYSYNDALFLPLSP